MIICTGCGTPNANDALICEKCRKKLQSAYNPASESSDSRGPIGQFQHNGVSDDLRNDLARMIEAWAYVLLLAGTAGACFYYETWWPLYPAIGVLALIVWLRKI